MKIKIKTGLTLLIFLYVITYLNISYAQEQVLYNIKGTLASTQKTGMEEITLQLLKASDNSLVKLEFPNASGAFVFEKIPSGEYILVTQSLNFAKYQSEKIYLNNNLDLGIINLKALNNNLKEVTVTATKPFVQQEYDKTVINVSSSISAAGSTALEVLQKAPGITVDQNDNIAMRGRQGVLVMIDGKLVPMSGQDLANMLKSMSASQIEKIDLITNPSAKYDASGNSGIIDIRLKKGTTAGLNGNASVSYGQGSYSKFNPAISLNAKGKKLNTFASYSYSGNNNFNKLDIFRDFYNTNQSLSGSINYNNYFKFNFKNHNLRLGTDYNIGKNTVIGFVANGILTDGSIASDSRAAVYNGQNQNTGFYNTLGDNDPKRNNKSFNLNFKQTLDTLGKELTADMDYATFNSNELQNYQTHYFNAMNQPSANPYFLLGDLSGDLNIKSFKLDYTQPIKEWGIKLETGLKSSWVTSDNDVQFFDKSSGSPVLDVSKSNHFIYKENINAAYLNTSKSWKQLSLQLGLRMENTIADGLQLTDNTTFERNYTQFFPSGYMGYKVNKNNDLGISLSRRINRPSYRQLNPFKVFLDPLTYSSGNPYLKPELTNSFEFTYTFMQKYSAKLSYSRTKDNILNVLSPDTEPNTVIQTGRNLAKYDYYSFSLNIPFTIGNWFNSSNNALTYYDAYTGYLANTDLNTSRVNFNLNSNNSVVINKTMNAEIIANYRSKSYYGFLDIGNNWDMTLGLQQNFWNKKGSVKLSVSDIFYSSKIVGNTRLSGYGEQFFQSRDTRLGTLTFSYKFGKPANQANRRKTGGAEEEKRRAG